MNFIYLANVRLPTEKAHGIQIMKTCEALAKQGAQVELIVPKRRNRLAGDPFSFYSVEKKFTITTVWCWDLVSHNFFGKLGFWLESWTFFCSLKKYLRTKPVAVVYTRDLTLAYWVSKIYPQVFYEIHALPEITSVRHWSTWNRVNGLVVISNGLKTELVRRGVSAEKISVAHDAVDLKDFAISESKKECREKLQLPIHQKIVVYTGHLYEWKGAHVLAKAALSLPPEIEVYVVGGTREDVEKMQRQFQAVNLHFVGWQEHSKMVYWQKAADVLVLPTSAQTPVGARYTSPLKLFEYLASGTPIIASDSPALREILSEKNAVLVRPDYPEALQKAILELLRNPAMYANLGVNANQNSEHYSWEKRANIILDFVT